MPQACVERDDGGRRDLPERSIKEARLPEHPEHTQTSRETCGDCAGGGAAAWAGGRATCDELEMRHSKNKATDTCGLMVRRHWLPSLRLICLLKTTETSLGHCFGRLRLS